MLQHPTVATQGLRAFQMLREFVLGQLVDFRGAGAGKTVEKRIPAAVPFHFLQSICSRQSPVELEYFRERAYRDTDFSIREGGDADDIVPAAAAHKILLLRAVVAHAHVPPEIPVDCFHNVAEHPSVRGCVTNATERDVEMNHLVNDDILQFFGRQIEACAYLKLKIITGGGQPEQVTPSFVFHLAEEGPRLRQHYRHRRQFASKAQRIEAVECLLYERQGCCHFRTKIRKLEQNAYLCRNSKLMTIRPATIGDLPRLMEIYREARETMLSCGNVNQWKPGHPSEELIRNDIENGYCRAVEDRGGIIGAFAFIPGADPTYRIIEGGRWVDDCRPYSTIHRLAGAKASHGVAKACFDWCWEQRRNLRVDTHEDNIIMRRCIEKSGFTYCGIIHLKDGAPRIAYQKIQQ